jgi:hypothetical protein
LRIGFPATREAIHDAGYDFVYARPCKRCGANLEFHRSPAKAFVPLESVIVEGKWLLDSHFKTCPFRDEFKRPKLPEFRQGNLF